MTYEEFYGPALAKLQAAEHQLTSLIACLPETQCEGPKPVLYCISRIKSPESMMRKLQKNGLPPDCTSALEYMHDAVGVRVICSFLDDVYRVADWLTERLRVVQTKDYISFPKPNGYRSLHLIVGLTDGPAQGLTAEIQLRTIAIDCWASLEHQLKYKRSVAHETLVRAELKRCAEEIASIDLSMQTIRELLAQDA